MASGFAENVRARKQKYNQAAQRCLQDGIIDEHERSQLEALRKELGLDSDEALQLLNGIKRQARRPALVQCPHCGERLG